MTASLCVPCALLNVLCMILQCIQCYTLPTYHTLTGTNTLIEADDGRHAEAPKPNQLPSTPPESNSPMLGWRRWLVLAVLTWFIFVVVYNFVLISVLLPAGLRCDRDANGTIKEGTEDDCIDLSDVEVGSLLGAASAIGAIIAIPTAWIADHTNRAVVL